MLWMTFRRNRFYHWFQVARTWSTAPSFRPSCCSWNFLEVLPPYPAAAAAFLFLFLHPLRAIPSPPYCLSNCGVHASPRPLLALPAVSPLASPCLLNRSPLVQAIDNVNPLGAHCSPQLNM